MEAMCERRVWYEGVSARGSGVAEREDTHENAQMEICEITSNREEDVLYICV